MLNLKRYLGIDHGLKNIGLAMGDDETFLAFPYDVIDGADQKSALFQIRDICLGESIQEIIIGIPIMKDGKNHAQAEIVKDFVKELQSLVYIPVEMIDERFSTRMAQKLNPDSDDSVAAAIILQNHFDKLKMQSI